MNSYEEQQQHRRSNAKQCLAHMGASRVCRYSQQRIRREWQQNMKQPVLEIRLVRSLYSQAPSYDHKGRMRWRCPAEIRLG
jgi:hypothetical protein